MGDLSKRAMLEQILAAVTKILEAESAPRFRFRVGPIDTRNPSQGTFDMALTLTDIQHVAVTLEADDAAGNPTAFDFPTPPTWTSSDETIVTVSPSTDGSNADVVTTGKLGTAQIRVKGVLASGKEVNGLGDIEVVTSAPSTFKLNFGAPADK